MKTKKRLHFRKNFQENENQTVEIYTVRSHKLSSYDLVNLSVRGLAIQCKVDSENEASNFQNGDLVFINLKGLGVEAQGVSAKIVRTDVSDEGREYGLIFMTESTGFKESIESAIGWSQVRRSLQKPRSQAHAIYNGQDERPEIPEWLENLIPFKKSANLISIKNPIEAKSHLVEWIEGSLDGDQLEVTLSQAV